MNSARIPSTDRGDDGTGLAWRLCGGAVVGVGAGLPVGALLTYQGMLADRGAGVVPAWLVYLVSVAAVGAVIGLIVGYQPHALASASSGGVLVGLLGWLLWSLTLDPVLRGQLPTWSIDAAAASYRGLVADLLQGGLAGALWQSLATVVARRRPGPTLRERADRPRVVIVGGGFAGVGAARRFERLAVRAGSPDVTLISDSNFLLFTPMLAEAARVTEASSRDVSLSDGTLIPTATFVWTAGNRPSPLMEKVSGEHAHGALVTDPMLRVPGLEGVWAVGDCARIPDPANDGAAYPPTAQHALRQGKVVANNITAVLAGRSPEAFRFSTIGVLVALGHRTAAAEIRGHRFSGLAAWVMWRGIYLAKLPGAEKRIRVFLDWLLDLAFPRDIVITDAEPPDPVPQHLTRARDGTRTDGAQRTAELHGRRT